MYLIVGLGNPGEKYKGTRHNIGFMVTGEFAERNNIKGSFSRKFNAILGKGKFKDEEVMILQPQTYMNLSGNSVSAVLSYYKISLDKLIVVYDDIALDFGRLRLRPSGSAGGHNGIKSIISSCGSDNFSRLRLGIGPNPGEHLWKTFVLQKFSNEEKKHLNNIIETSVHALEDYLENGMDSAMNKYNGMHV